MSVPRYWHSSLAWLLPGEVERLHVEDLHAVGWGKGPRSLLTTVGMGVASINISA